MACSYSAGRSTRAQSYPLRLLRYDPYPRGMFSPYPLRFRLGSGAGISSSLYFAMVLMAIIIQSSSATMFSDPKMLKDSPIPNDNMKKFPSQTLQPPGVPIVPSSGDAVFPIVAAINPSRQIPNILQHIGRWISRHARRDFVPEHVHQEMLAAAKASGIDFYFFTGSPNSLPNNP